MNGVYLQYSIRYISQIVLLSVDFPRVINKWYFSPYRITNLCGWTSVWRTQALDRDQIPDRDILELVP